MEKIAQIRALVSVGRAADVRELLVGISRYCASVIVPGPWNAEEMELRQMAELHLDFVAKYGLDAEQAKDGKLYRFCYPRDFERWLDFGAPGVAEEDLAAYISENPIHEFMPSPPAA